ncbi:MAG: glycosyltransferase family 4 protein [Actinobacteria bacterium]|nr:glycosyltransferase family 4 protein [Actinomycetota bacterium]
MTEQPLSFCMVTTFYPPHHFGGDAMYVHRLSAELTRQGHDVTVVYPPDAYRALGGRAEHDEPEESAVNVVRLDDRLGRVAPTLTYLTGRPALRAGQLRFVLESGQFDVVHFHNVSLVGGPGVLALGSGIKLYTTHEHWLVCPMHVLWKNNSRPCERPQCFRCTLAFHRPPQLWRYGSLLERSAAHVDLFLSPSRFTIRMHRERGFEHPMRHLPYFIPTASTPHAEPHEHGRPYYLVVGRLERLKGVHTLIEAFGRYDRADLLVVGDGTYAAELRRQAAGLRNVRFLGRRPFRELQALYAGAVAVLQPSVGYETFGMTVVEGFSQGTPAIVRDLGALPEVIEESGGGFIYRTNEELVAHMERLRVDPDLGRELGEQGRRAHAELWSPAPHLDRYLSIIEAEQGQTA